MFDRKNGIQKTVFQSDFALKEYWKTQGRKPAAQFLNMGTPKGSMRDRAELFSDFLPQTLLDFFGRKLPVPTTVPDFSKVSKAPTTTIIIYIIIYFIFIFTAQAHRFSAAPVAVPRRLKAAGRYSSPDIRSEALPP